MTKSFLSTVDATSTSRNSLLIAGNISCLFTGGHNTEHPALIMVSDEALKLLDVDVVQVPSLVDKKSYVLKHMKNTGDLPAVGLMLTKPEILGKLLTATFTNEHFAFAADSTTRAIRTRFTILSGAEVRNHGILANPPATYVYMLVNGHDANDIAEAMMDGIEGIHDMSPKMTAMMLETLTFTSNHHTSASRDPVGGTGSQTHVLQAAAVE